MTQQPSTAAEVQAWVAKAKEGTRLLYHVGNMALERGRARLLNKAHPKGEAFAELQDQARAGYVSLMQRRMRTPDGAEPRYEYWAERRFKKPDHERSVLRHR